MHKLKHVHDTFKVLRVFFSPKPLHSLQYLTTNITFKILHSYLQCARKTMKRFSTTASSKRKSLQNSCTSRPWNTSDRL